MRDARPQNLVKKKYFHFLINEQTDVHAQPCFIYKDCLNQLLELMIWEHRNIENEVIFHIQIPSQLLD